MGSVRQRLAEATHVCNVVLVGDVRVGKTALVHTFANAKFPESYRATSLEKTTVTGRGATAVSQAANRKVKLVVWDTTGSRTSNQNRSSAYAEADVFLLCYKISDPSTLFSALTHWCAEVRAIAPSTPIVLVGCAADLRSDRDVLSALAKQGKAPVSADQALSFCRQMGALTYVETSARVSPRTATTVFEVAALAAFGRLPRKANGSSQRSTPSPRSAKRGLASEEPAHPEPTDPLWEHISYSKSFSRSQSDSCGNSLSSKNRSTSIPSISSGSKTPKSARKASFRGSQSTSQLKTMTIVCQRLTSDRTYEEIEVEVPAPIYETLQLYNNSDALTVNGSKNKQSTTLAAKIRKLFTSRH